MPVSITPPAQLPPPKPDHSFTRRPNSAVAVFFWRWRMWVESTFVLSMLEPWEKILLLSIFSVLFLLIGSGIVMYFPRHLGLMHRRVVYYLWGQEGDERFLWQRLGLAGALHKEL